MGNKSTRVASSSSATASLSGVGFESITTTPSGLRLGDRVVWLYERGDEFQVIRSWEQGTIKWLGYIHIKNEVCAGIEFDRPLGLGSGWYNNVQIFTCEADHGAFVNINGLILERNFDKTNTSNQPTTTVCNPVRVAEAEEKEPGTEPAASASVAESPPSPSLSRSSLVLNIAKKYIPLGAATATVSPSPFATASSASTTINDWNPPKIIDYNRADHIQGQAAAATSAVSSSHGPSRPSLNSALSTHRPPIFELPTPTHKSNHSHHIQPQTHACAYTGDNKRQEKGFSCSSMPTEAEADADTATTMDFGEGEGFDFGPNSRVGRRQRRYSNAAVVSRVSQPVPTPISTQISPVPDDEYQLSTLKPFDMRSFSRRSPQHERQQQQNNNSPAQPRTSSTSTSWPSPPVFQELPRKGLSSSWPAPERPQPPKTPEPAPASQSPFLTPSWTHATYTSMSSTSLKGIQGDKNSCYMDSALFSLFSFTSVLDNLLELDLPSPPAQAKEQNQGEAKPDARKVQAELRHIVNQLRRTHYVPREDVTRLRQSMAYLSDKFLSEEMDTQEFLQLLFQNVFRLPAFVRVAQNANAGQQQEGDYGDFFHQILLPEPATTAAMKQVPTVQQLLVASFQFQNLQLRGSPDPCFILQMPRSGNSYKTFAGIVPNLTMDISEILETDRLTPTPGRTSPCLLRLFAVICIEYNHFVSFVRVPRANAVDAKATNDPWLFFDSMANRDRLKQYSGGGEFVLEPRVRKLPDLGAWLEEVRSIQEDKNKGPLSMNAVAGLEDDKFGLFKQLLKDVYMCFYSPLP